MVASSIPQNCSNQRKSVFPAVCANGRFKVGSRGPGAWPMIITLLAIAPPETGVDCMRGQRRQRSSAFTCSSSRFWRVAVATALWAVRTWMSNSQDQTAIGPCYSIEIPRLWNFSAGKLRRATEANSRQCLQQCRSRWENRTRNVRARSECRRAIGPATSARNRSTTPGLPVWRPRRWSWWTFQVPAHSKSCANEAEAQAWE